VDETRGLGIALVVFGHTLRGLSAANMLSDAPFWALLDHFIYAFHMPLFFFVSGLFLLPGRDEPYLTFAQRRLLRLGYPYLIWATAQTLIQCLLSRYTNHAVSFDAVLRIGFDPPMQFWFLYALFLQVLWIGLCAKLRLGRGAILALALLLYLSAPYVPLGDWTPLNQAREGLIFTALGVFCGTPRRLAEVERQPARAYGVLAAAGYLMVGILVLAELTENHLVSLVAALFGIMASVSCSELLLQSRSPSARRGAWLLTRWGEASLAIFVAHTLVSAAVRIGLSRVLGLQNVALHLLLGSVLGLCLPWALYAASRRFQLRFLFEWPRSAARRSVPPRISVAG
jgi:fucose 4-O-acetylase-like acetyltransferase